MNITETVSKRLSRVVYRWIVTDVGEDVAVARLFWGVLGCWRCGAVMQNARHNTMFISLLNHSLR